MLKHAPMCMDRVMFFNSVSSLGYLIATKYLCILELGCTNPTVFAIFVLVLSASCHFSAHHFIETCRRIVVNFSYGW